MRDLPPLVFKTFPARTFTTWIRGVLGRYAMREWFQDHGYMAMIFDFARLDNFDLTETVVTMAGLSKFIIADLSGPSVPDELEAILCKFKKPALAIGVPSALKRESLADNPHVITTKGDESNLLDALEKNLPKLLQLHYDRNVLLAERREEEEEARQNEVPGNGHSVS